MSQVPFQKNKLLKELCTLGIGGHAAYYIEVSTIPELQDAIRWCRKEGLNYFVLGKGSNCLFDDRGFDGAIIHNKIDFFESPKEGLFHMGSGYSFSLLGSQTARSGFGGLEFASGIPATVGGAVFMNAGANGGQASDCLVSVDYVDELGSIHCLNKQELLFGYRTSSFQTIKGAIAGATFMLEPSPEARQKQIDLIRYRQKTQPYKEMSAGCIFRNPCDSHAGMLIEQCGLKGFRIGDAMVSTMHANFLINTGAATAFDFSKLMAYVENVVEDKFKVKLESEVRRVPYRVSS